MMAFDFIIACCLGPVNWKGAYKNPFALGFQLMYNKCLSANFLKSEMLTVLDIAEQKNDKTLRHCSADIFLFVA